MIEVIDIRIVEGWSFGHAGYVFHCRFQDRSKGYVTSKSGIRHLKYDKYMSVVHEEIDNGIEDFEQCITRILCRGK